jgi:NAD(P)H dehydrogenase (quinone)
MNGKPIILTLGVTGQVGRLVADHLRQSQSVQLRVTSRRENDLPELKKEYGDAVYMDLDDPRTFAAAFAGVDSLFMLTGYTVAMLVQSKALVDAAKKAGVKHIVHLGVFSPEEDCYDQHFAWHQMVEAYIKVSRIPHTFLHPNCFMQNFTGFYGVAKNGKLRFYTSGKPVGWIALEDVGEASAKILIEGKPHYGKDYWFSTEVADIREAAKIFSEVTGKPFTAEDRAPDQFLKDMGKERDAVDAYFIGVEQSFIQIVDGRMQYIATVRDDLPGLIGRRGITLKEWALRHKDELLRAAGEHDLAASKT